MSEIQRFEKKIDLFVQQNNLEQADAIRVKKMPLKLVNHYIIYLGLKDGFHIFMANTLTGVKVYNYYDLMKDLETFIPEKIEKFVGSFQDRREAVIRALSRLNENSYNLILNNCEHFKNWVQNGIHRSKQVENASIATLGIGGLIAATSKSKGGLYAGIGLMLFGGLAWALSGENEELQEAKYIPIRKQIE